MGSKAPRPRPSEPAGATRRAIALVVFCTIGMTLAQAVLKVALSRETGIAALVLDPFFLAGLALMCASGVLLVLALRHGELSVVHPLLALGFVWVVLASFAIGERLAWKELCGIALIMAGVALVGRSGGAA